MQFIEVLEFSRLHGENAIEALYEFVDSIKRQRDKELTDIQTQTLIKFAWGLVSSLKAEKELVSSKRDGTETSSIGQLKRRIIRHSPVSFRTRENYGLEELNR
jgi:hypothetical protein